MSVVKESSKIRQTSVGHIVDHTTDTWAHWRRGTNELLVHHFGLGGQKNVPCQDRTGDLQISTISRQARSYYETDVITNYTNETVYYESMLQKAI